MIPRPPLPLEVVLKSGEVRCPWKGGIIALEACTTLQAVRSGESCRERRCHHTGHYELFVIEVRRSKSEDLAAPVIPIHPVHRQPGRRAWRRS